MNEIENIYGMSTEFYDVSALSQIKNKKIIMRKFAGMVKNLEGIVLDIGAGTGKTTVEMANMIPDKEIIAIEPSAYMRIAFMAKLMEYSKFKEQITLLPVNIDSYSFQDTISGVMCMGVLGHLKKDEQKNCGTN